MAQLYEIHFYLAGWKITSTSCACGGSWAWFVMRHTGAWESRGCICHNPWPLGVSAQSAYRVIVIDDAGVYTVSSS